MAEKGKIPVPKTQREIMNSQIEPYVPPTGAMGFSEIGNPNPPKLLIEVNKLLLEMILLNRFH